MQAACPAAAVQVPAGGATSAATSAATTAAAESTSGSGETTAAETAENDAEWFGNADGTPVHLRFWGGVQPEYGYDEVCERFNEEYKDKGIDVEYVRYVNDSDGNLQLDIYLQGGGEVDVFMGYGGIGRLNKRIDANLVLDMADYLKAKDFDLIEELGAVNMQNYVRDTGEVYGFPTKYENGRWLLANVDMFEEAGVPVPYDGWTYSEFMDAIEKLTHGEGQNKVYGMCWSVNENGSGLGSVLGSVLSPYSTYADDECKVLNYDNPVWKEGFEMVKASLDNGWAISFEDEKTENLKVANSFLNGMCAMSLCVSQMRLVMDLEAYPHDFTTALIPAPVPDGEEYNTPYYRTHASVTGAGDLMCIASKTEHPDAAFEFALWYLTGGMAPVSKGGRIPLWKGFDKDQVVAMITENAGDAIDAQSLRNYLSIDNTQGVKTLSPEWDGQIDDIVKEEKEALFYGRQDVDTTIANIMSRGTAMIEELSK